MSDEATFRVAHNLKEDGTPCGSEDVGIHDNCPVCEFSRAIICFGCGYIDRVGCACSEGAG